MKITLILHSLVEIGFGLGAFLFPQKLGQVIELKAMMWVRNYSITAILIGVFAIYMLKNFSNVKFVALGLKVLFFFHIGICTSIVVTYFNSSFPWQGIALHGSFATVFLFYSFRYRLDH